jgi:hypothetical protein
MQIGIGTLSVAEARQAGRTKLEGEPAALKRYRSLLPG